jgi:hypothetical protein
VSDKRVTPQYRESDKWGSDPSSSRRGGPPFAKDVKVWKEDSYDDGCRRGPETKNDCAAEDQQQFTGVNF